MASLCIETINKLRVVDLRTELEKRGLSRSGRKDILIERLKMSLLEDENTNKSSELADHGEATDLDKTTKASEQSSESSYRKELLVEDTYESSKPADHGKADELSNTWKASVMHNTEADGSRLEDLIKDLMRLIHDKLPQQVVANVTADQPAGLDHNLSIEMAEMKLELAMLWATVNSNQDICIQSQDKAPSTQSQSPSCKKASTQTVEREFPVKPPCHIELQNHPSTLKISLIATGRHIKQILKAKIPGEINAKLRSRRIPNNRMKTIKSVNWDKRLRKSSRKRVPKDNYSNSERRI